MSEEHTIEVGTVEQSSKKQVIDSLIDAAAEVAGPKKRPSPVRINPQKVNQWCTSLRKKLTKLLALESENFEDSLASRVVVCFEIFGFLDFRLIKS